MFDWKEKNTKLNRTVQALADQWKISQTFALEPFPNIYNTIIGTTKTNIIGD